MYLCYALYFFTYNDVNIWSYNLAEIFLHILLYVVVILKLINQMWFSIVSTLMDNNMQHHSGENIVDSLSWVPWVHNKLWLVWWHIVVDESTDNAKPHSICFLLQCQRQRKCFWELKKALCDTLTWAVLCGLLLTINGKLANQTVRLVAIVVKTHFDDPVIPLITSGSSLLSQSECV